MTVGPFVMGVGLVLLVRVGPGATYLAAVLPALAVFSAGLTLTVAPLTATALASVDDHHAGVASGVNNAVARTGGLLAVAVIPLVAGFSAGADVDPARLVDGFHRVVVAAGAAMVLAGLISWAFVRSDVLALDAGAAADDQDHPDHDHDHVPGAEPPCCTYHCAADAPPLAVDEAPAAHPSGTLSR
jgi:hypothetical protein